MLPASAPMERTVAIEEQRQRWIVRHEKLLSLNAPNEEGEQGDYTLDYAPDSSIDAGRRGSESSSAPARTANATHELWQSSGAPPISSFSKGRRKHQHRPAPLDLASAMVRRESAPQQQRPEQRRGSEQQLALPGSGQFIMVSSPSRTLLKHAEPATALSGLVSPFSEEDQEEPPPSARSVQAILEKQRQEMIRFTQKVLKQSASPTPLSAPSDAFMLPPVSPFQSERPTVQLDHGLKHQSSPPAPQRDQSWSWLKDVQHAPLSDSFELSQIHEHRLPRPESSPQLSTSHRMASRHTGTMLEHAWPAEPNFKGLPPSSSPKIAEQHGNDGHSAAIEALIQQLRFPDVESA